MKFTKKRFQAYLKWRLSCIAKAIDDKDDLYKHSKEIDAVRASYYLALRSVFDDVENWKITEFNYAEKIAENIS